MRPDSQEQMKLSREDPPTHTPPNTQAELPLVPEARHDGRCLALTVAFPQTPARQPKEVLVQGPGGGDP